MDKVEIRDCEVMSVAETERLNSYTWPTEGNCRVPFWVYTDPGVYKLEQELIFRGSTWNYVGLEAEIPNPGDFKTTYIGDTSVIVVRDEEDSINALVNKCGHRGASLSHSLRQYHGFYLPLPPV